MSSRVNRTHARRTRGQIPHTAKNSARPDASATQTATFLNTFAGTLAAHPLPSKSAIHSVSSHASY
jgi:hypothetical protein